MLLSSFDSALVDIPCIVSGIGSILLLFFHLHIHWIYLQLLCKYTSVPKPTWTLTPVIVYVSFKSLFTIETIQLKSVKVLKSWKIPTEKLCRYWRLNPGLQLPIMSLLHILLNSIDADMKSEIGSSRGGLRPYPLRFHFKEAGADAKLIQHGPLGVAYHRRHPISTVPVARMTAHATVPGF